MKKVLVVGHHYALTDPIKNKLGEDVVVVALNAESDVSHLIQELSERELARDFDNLNKNVMQIKPIHIEEPILLGTPLTGQELRRRRRAQERKAAKKWK